MTGKGSFYENVLPSGFHSHPPTFTHGDLQQKTIPVRAKQASSNAIVFVEWEVAGWYPSFRKFAQTVGSCRLFQDDRHHWIPQFLDLYLSEYAWLHPLLDELD